MIFAPQPFYLIDFLFDFQRFQIVKFWLVTLEGAVDCVLALLGPSPRCVSLLRVNNEKISFNK